MHFEEIFLQQGKGDGLQYRFFRLVRRASGFRSRLDTSRDVRWKYVLSCKSTDSLDDRQEIESDRPTF
jgi:hypothetical protein